MRTALAFTWLWPLIAAAPLAAQSTAPVEPAAGASVGALEPKLVGNRFPPLQWAEMSEAQQTMARHVLDGPRTSMNGPFNVMLRSPLMGDYAQELGAQIRFNSSLPPALREMAILMVVRRWTSHYEWNAHKATALAEGLDPAIVTAIAQVEQPRSMQPNAAALFRFCSELLDTTRVSTETFEAAKAAFGERGVAEIVFTLGYYGMVSMMLNVDEHPLPEGVAPELDALDD